MFRWFYERIIYGKINSYISIHIDKEGYFPKGAKEICFINSLEKIANESLNGSFKVTSRGYLIKINKIIYSAPILELDFQKNKKGLSKLISKQRCLFGLKGPGDVYVGIAYDGKNFLVPDLVFCP